MKITSPRVRPDASVLDRTHAASTAAPAQPAAGPQPIDAELLKLVSGGLPRGGWQTSPATQDAKVSGSW